MKISKFILETIILVSKLSTAQVNPRMVHRDYAQTIFQEDFSSSSLDQTKWVVSNRTSHERNLFAFKDTTATVYLNPVTDKLDLRIIKIPNGYTYLQYDGSYNTVYFLAGGIRSQLDFPYGVYECEATFSHNKGAFPAFWLYNDSDCSISKRDEIDIVECKVWRSNPTYDTHILHHPDCSGDNPSLKFTEHPFSDWNSSHVFKCVYAPDRIEFWVDDTHLNTVINDGDYKYPDQRVHILLSQQAIRYDDKPSEIITPQTSSFNWVKAKEFFLAPEITFSSDLICTSGTASMDVDSEATNISWSLSPTSLFTGATSGTGNNASFNVSSSASGEGTITYSFEMPGGETFTAEESFWAGRPGTPLTIPSGYPTLEMALGAYQPISIFKSPGAYGGNINWWCTGSIEIDGASNANTCTFEATDLGIGNFYVTTQNTCGTSPTGGGAVNVVSGGGGQMMLVISPNPACNEVSITIESELEEEITLMSNETILDTNIEWNLEIYDNLQSLKLKKKKLKGKSTVIETHGWKEGIYLVRAKYKEEILQGKLMVKK